MTPSIEMRPIEEVRRYERNPRANLDAVDAVAESIRRFGWRQPIVIDGEGVIVAGDTRYLAARQLGLEQVPTLSAADLSEEEVRAYRIADNRTAENAQWDEELLAIELGSLDEELQAATAFTEEERARLLAALPGEPPPEFPPAGEGEPEFKCPRCSYEWRGNPR